MGNKNILGGLGDSGQKGGSQVLLLLHQLGHVADLENKVISKINFS